MQDTISVAESVLEWARQYTSDVIYAAAAALAAEELARLVAPPPERPDLASCVALDLDGTVRHLADLWGPPGVGLDLDIVASWLAPQLLDAGVREHLVLAALWRVCGWRPRSDDDRRAAVLRALVETDGFAPDVAEAALAEAFAGSPA